MYKRLPFAALLTLGMLLPSSASAVNTNQGIYGAACRYRDAVVNFERVVVRVRGIDRVDEKFVDKFEEATKKLHLAARNPRLSNRLRYEWSQILPLQYQVEARIFNKYTLHHELVQAWDLVLYAQALFEDEYVYQYQNPRHGNSVTRRITRSNPSRYLPPPPASSGRLYTEPNAAGR